MAFYSCAALAASLMPHDSKNTANPVGATTNPSFQMRIFFSGRIPVVPESAEIRATDRGREGAIIKIPTAHFWGSNDT